MEDERDAEALEGSPGELRPLNAGRWRQGGAKHIRESHTRLLEDGAVRKHPGTASAPVRPFPEVLAETFRAIFFLDRRAEAVLEGEEVGADGGGVDNLGAHPNLLCITEVEQVVARV
jgi:hypothetical protein